MESALTGTSGFERNLEILLVEDNQGDAVLLTDLLKESGAPVNIQIVSEGESAIHYLCRKGPYSEATRPDVVILDLNLPKKNGFEVLEEIRRHPNLSSLPVLMLTGSENKEDIERGSSLNVAAFLTKPADLSELEQMVNKLLTVDLPQVLPPLSLDK